MITKKEAAGKVRVTKFSVPGSEYIARQRVDVDPFENLYNTYDLIEPPYRFDRLYSIYDESDVLQFCISTLQKNVDGFGYRLQFLGDDLTERNTPAALAQEAKLKGFFDNVNEEGSFQDIRMPLREDFEVLGNGAMEAVRFPRSKALAALYYMPVMDLRISRLDPEPIIVTVPLVRDGVVRPVKVKKRFRRYAQILSGITEIMSGERVLRWFKQFGDPRTLDAVTGEYVSSPKEAKEVATEILWFKRSSSNRTYGVPRWIGNVTDVRGRSLAQYVNYDLFDSQGIPPMMIIVENGTLTDESRDELHRLISGMRGPENFNKVGLLEAIPELQGLDDKGSVRVELKNLTEFRNNDVIFKDYLDYTEAVVRKSFRLPGIYMGAESNLSYASSYSSQKLAESQVFIPERIDFDDVINHCFVQNKNELDCPLWRYVSTGPQLVSAEELRLAMKQLESLGALTINHSIDIANELFGLNMSKYDDEWADLPISLVKTMAQNNTFVLEAIQNVEEVVQSARSDSGDQGGRPESSTKPTPLVGNDPTAFPGQADGSKQRR